MTTKTIVHRTPQNRVFYAKNVNMNYSFDRLSELAKKMLGADLELGDILVCDNVNGDKRKVMQWTKDGFMIYYGRLHKLQFTALAENDGLIKRKLNTLL